MRSYHLGLVLLAPLALTLSACFGSSPPEDDDEDSNMEADADTDADSDSDTDADSDADSDTDSDTDVDCHSDWDSGFYGSIDASIVTNTAYSNSSGLSDIVAADPGEGETTEISVAISGAVVTQVGYYPDSATEYTFWLGDGDAHVQAYYITLDEAPSAGDTVSFTATELTNYYGKLEITAATDYAVTGSSDVYVNQATGTTLDYSDSGPINVRLYGELIEDRGDCGGGNTCYELEHGGEGAGNIAVIRTDSEYVAAGDCMIITAPLGEYSGEVQIDVDDYDWYINAY